MGDINGFMKHRRAVPQGRPVNERLKDYREVFIPLPSETVQVQGARCMDCGVPTCHNGCPLGNLIPDWNDLAFRGQWQKAIDQLHRTNNFPEFTGHVCPAPCEPACIEGINLDPVSIKAIELKIIEYAWEKGWIRPEPPKIRTGKKIAVIGSGPSGLAAAQQLNRAGHSVTVFEKDDRIGGLLTYGIPHFKLEKHLVKRRVAQMMQEGVIFRAGVHAGAAITGEQLRREFDVIVLACGAQQPRDLPVEGRSLKGIHFAMEFLPQQNRRCEGDEVGPGISISAKDKNVVVIGGGDTGSDCVGTSLRQGAASVVSLEVLPKPPVERLPSNPWPQWPQILRTSSSHEEGGERRYGVLTKKFTGESGEVRQLHGMQIKWEKDASGRMKMVELPGTEFVLQTELVLLAMGFLGPVKTGLVEQLGVKLDARGNIAADADKMTSVPGVFTAGDATRGQSLVVWAISEGRKAAQCVDRYLMSKTLLTSVL
jgi:glutamate synthase (NADPH/NADH) small chain